MMKDKSLLAAWLLGGTLVVLCCAAPLLVLLLGATGLSAAAGYLDDALLAMLAAIVALTAHALWRRNRSAHCAGGACRDRQTADRSWETQ